MALKPLPFAFNAQTPSKGIVDAFTADLAIIRTQLRPRGKRRAPVDLELHANPAALGVLAVGLGLGMWLLQLRIAPVRIMHGYWEWPDGTKASKEIPSNKKGVPPTRRVPTDAPVTNDPFNPYGGYNIETASWVPTEEKDTYFMRERQGFLGDGTGTQTGDGLGSMNPVKWLTDPFGLFPW